MDLSRYAFVRTGAGRRTGALAFALVAIAAFAAGRGAATAQDQGNTTVTLLSTPSGWVVQGHGQPAGGQDNPHVFLPAAPTSAPTSGAHRRNWMTTPTSRTGDWPARHAQFLETARRGGIGLLFVGDSITDGWRGTGLKTWNAYFAPFHAANFGLSGDGTQNVLWRIAHGELDGINPRVTVLLIGTNDIPWTAKESAMDSIAADVADAVGAVVDAIRAKLPSTRIVLLGIFPRGENPNPSRVIIAKVNQYLAGLSSGQVTYLDIGHVFLSGNTISKSIMPDFLHPSAAGYVLWARAMAPTVWKRLAGY